MASMRKMEQMIIWQAENALLRELCKLFYMYYHASILASNDDGWIDIDLNCHA